MDLVQKAIEFAVTHHAGQYRKGEDNSRILPYVVHPIQVMKVIYDWQAGTQINLIAAVCHDLIEDTQITREKIAEIFGEEVAYIVAELSFDDQDAKFSERAALKTKYLESFKSKSLSALIIKIADRACNVQDFINSGDGKYAAKYAAKAQPLYEVAMDRLDEIESVYGFRTRQSIHHVLGELLNAAFQSQITGE